MHVANGRSTSQGYWAVSEAEARLPFLFCTSVKNSHVLHTRRPHVMFISIWDVESSPRSRKPKGLRKIKGAEKRGPALSTSTRWRAHAKDLCRGWFLRMLVSTANLTFPAYCRFTRAEVMWSMGVGNIQLEKYLRPNYEPGGWMGTCRFLSRPVSIWIEYRSVRYVDGHNGFGSFDFILVRQFDDQMWSL